MNNLIPYKVEYRKRSDRWHYPDATKSTKIARIVMRKEEIEGHHGYSWVHGQVERKFFKHYEGLEDNQYSSDRYLITRVRKWK
mgnify:FL=1